SRRRLALAALVLAAAPRAAAAGAGRDDPDPALVAVARAFGAAWSAHDLAAGLAGFAPGAGGRERHGALPAAGRGTPGPPGGARVPGRRPRRGRVRPGRLLLGDRTPAARGVGGGALRAGPPHRARLAPRHPGHGGLAVPRAPRRRPGRARHRPPRRGRGSGRA